MILLGPQRPVPNLKAVLDTLDVKGPLVAITAGWRHDESELDTLVQHVGPIVHLPLYRWFDEMHEHAPDIAAAYHARQDRIGRFKDLYRLRVHAALATVRDLLHLLPTDPELVGREIERASEVVRDIDAQALGAVDEVREAYARLSDRWDVAWVRDRRDEAKQAIDNAGAVLVAGGHVAVLRNRMLFFALEHAIEPRLRAGMPLVCWGAGAMVMSKRIVLFYDDPPEGPAEPEVLDHGLGFADGLVLFPHAGERLRLKDGERVAALARRFQPDTCLALECGAWVERLADGRWVSRGPDGTAFTLDRDGETRALAGA